MAYPRTPWGGIDRFRREASRQHDDGEHGRRLRSGAGTGARSGMVVSGGGATLRWGLKKGRRDTLWVTARRSSDSGVVVRGLFSSCGPAQFTCTPTLHKMIQSKEYRFSSKKKKSKEYRGAITVERLVRCAGVKPEPIWEHLQ